MLKFLYPQVNWELVDVVGFDMDGTLYDEAEFIAQVYEPIAEILAEATGKDSKELYTWMMRRWFEKGSSYPRIFSEAIGGGSLDGGALENVVRQCVDVFRDFEPKLTLPVRTRTILDLLHARYPLFMVTDGSEALQKRKFSSLGLSRWFEPVDVAISGTFGAGFSKPSIKMVNKIGALGKGHLPERVVFFGDRHVDADFAENAGFQFVRVANMNLDDRGLAL